MASQGEDLACPQISWTGIKPSQLDFSDSAILPNLIPLTLRDRLKILNMLGRDYVFEDVSVKKELERMMLTGVKAEIQIFSTDTLFSSF